MKKTSTLILAAFLMFAAITSAQSVATLPFLDEFTAGSNNPAWTFQSTGNGFVHVDAPPSTSPGSGGDALLFDATTSGSNFINEAILTINLSGQPGVVVRYLAREAADENNANDGLFVSDGTTTVLAVSHHSLTSSWEEIELDLGAFAAANGLILNNAFQLIFRQEDNFPIPTDGLIIDDVRVVLPPAADSGQANQPLAGMVIDGALNLNGNPAVVGENGPFFVTTTQLDITFNGMSQQPYILLAGPLNRNNHVFVPEGSLDIGFLGGSNNYSDVFVVINGLNPVGFFDLLAITNAAGEGSLSLPIDNLPPGILTTLQALVYRPSAPFVGLTAAFEISIP